MNLVQQLFTLTVLTSLCLMGAGSATTAGPERNRNTGTSSGSNWEHTGEKNKTVAVLNQEKVLVKPRLSINNSYVLLHFSSSDGGLQRSTTPETSPPTSSTFGTRSESSPSSSSALRTISGLTRAECFLTWRGTEAASTRGTASAKSSRMVKIYSLE